MQSEPTPHPETRGWENVSNNQVVIQKQPIGIILVFSLKVPSQSQKLTKNYEYAH